MKKEKTSWRVHLFFILFGLICLIPFLIVISSSLSSEENLIKNGFGILPTEIDFSAYKYIFATPKVIFNAYKITIFVTFAGTFLSLAVMSLTAYALCRKQFVFRKFLTWYIYIPTLFSGGLTSSYIINTKYLGMANNIWVLILPGLVGVFEIFMIRTFFQQLPESLYEATKIDGGSEYTIFFRIVLPLSKPVLATVGFLGALTRWNSWYEAMIYIRKDELVTLQYLLQRMMMNIQDLLAQMQHTATGINIKEIPGENLRMAMLVVAIGPMMCFFPFFQKYFTTGMTVGSVKG